MFASSLSSIKRLPRFLGGIHGFSNTVKYYKEMHDPFEHATGIEKAELKAYAAGCNDPFLVKRPLKRGCGSKEEPNMVPSAFDARLVGCVCHEYQRFVCWMWLERGCPKRCECGYWFKIDEIDPFYNPGDEEL